jgi:hypothetical protein
MSCSFLSFDERPFPPSGEWNGPSLIWESSGPDCFKELGDKAVSYGARVNELRVSGIPFLEVRNSIDIVLQNCPNLGTLWLDSVSLQEHDLKVLQGMAIPRLRISSWKFELELELLKGTWALELNVKNDEASMERVAFVMLLESLQASRNLVLRLKYGAHQAGSVSGLIDLLNLVFGRPLHLKYLRVQCSLLGINP